jgi:hypothetical protein
MIKKAQEKSSVDAINSIESGSFIADTSEEGPGDADVEGDMLITDAEAEAVLRDQTSTPGLRPRSKPKEDQTSIRKDVDEIVQGM